LIPASFIQDLLSRVDIVDVVGRYVQLKKGGANYMGLCPFHNEKSPSFTVSPTKQFYHCFGCGAHGSAIGFLMEYSGLGYVDAIKDLAQGVGLTVPQSDDRLPPAKRAEAQAKTLALSEAMSRAADYYRHQLRAAPQAIAYLQKRGLTGEIAARFGLGYAPAAWDSLRSVFSNYEDAALVESGLVIDRAEEGSPRKRYDRFRDRIMFPIRNAKGQVIAFGGRVMDGGEPKYLNSPETPLFQKGSELYGLFESRQAIREAGYVLVTEGYMDVVALSQLGFPQAVATLGTACTPIHVQKLLRQTDQVVFSFDGDAAGRRAARRALDACLPHATDSKIMKFLFLPASDDPDSYVREHGAAAFEAQVRDAMPLSQFLLNEVSAEGEMHTAEGRARAQFHAKAMLQAMPASSLRLQIVRGLAQMTQTTPTEIESLFELSQPVAPRRRMAPPPRRGRAAPVDLETKVIRLLIAQPTLAVEMDAPALAAMSESSADGGAMLAQLLDIIRSMGDQPSFVALTEQLRSAGSDFDQLVTDIAAEAEYEPEVARLELLGAVRQTRMKQIDAEMARLTASGAHTPETLSRLRELWAQREQLRQQAASDAAAS
jgi:DNA primase